MNNEKYPYEKSWKQHRLLTRLMTTGIVLGFIFPILTCVKIFAPLENLLLAAALFMIIIYLASYAGLMSRKCPQCGESYFGWTRDATPGFSESCKNCGLHEYEGSSFQ